MIERKLKEIEPENFNSTNDENDSYKNRSDDKGPEPEAIEIIKYKGMTLALVGLERQGGVMVFNISNPIKPTYVTYINNRDFSVEDAESRIVGDLGIEDIIFIENKDYPIVATANEVSGTISLFSVDLAVVPSESCDVAVGNNELGEMVISGLGNHTAAVYIYDGNNNLVFSCEAWENVCNSSEIFNNLDPNFYNINIKTWDQGFKSRCDIFTSLYIGNEGIVNLREDKTSINKVKQLSDENLQIEVFPNPARNFVNFRVEELIGQKVDIEITNMMGQKLSNQTFDALPSRVKTKTQSWSKGVYMVSFLANDGNSHSTYFVIQ